MIELLYLLITQLITIYKCVAKTLCENNLVWECIYRLNVNKTCDILCVGQ